MSSLKRENDESQNNGRSVKRRKGEENNLSDEEEKMEESASHLEDGELVPNDIIEEGVIDEECLSEDSAEEGELNNDTEREAIELKVNRDLSEVAASGVSQKDVRYFTASNVICEECGIKGHMSFICQQQKGLTCYKCGEPGHLKDECNQELKNLLNEKRSRYRRVGAPREPTISCFVCGGKNHLDCSVGKLNGKLSCANCGRAGHSLHSCGMPRTGAVMSTVKRIHLETKDAKQCRSKFTTVRKGNGNFRSWLIYDLERMRHQPRGRTQN